MTRIPRVPGVRSSQPRPSKRVVIDGGGLVTLHASNPADFFDRVEQMVAQAGVDPAPQRRVLMKTLQRIVWIRRRPGGGRDIVGVYRPDGYDAICGYKLARIDVPHLAYEGYGIAHQPMLWR